MMQAQFSYSFDCLQLSDPFPNSSEFLRSEFISPLVASVHVYSSLLRHAEPVLSPSSLRDSPFNLLERNLDVVLDEKKSTIVSESPLLPVDDDVWQKVVEARARNRLEKQSSSRTGKVETESKMMNLEEVLKIHGTDRISGDIDIGINRDSSINTSDFVPPRLPGPGNAEEEAEDTAEELRRARELERQLAEKLEKRKKRKKKKGFV